MNNILHNFKLLTKKNIRYCIIRDDFDTLNTNKYDGDIDIWVNKKDNKRLIKFFRKNNFSLKKLKYNRGFFLLQLTQNGIIKIHVQNKIFFHSKRKLLFLENIKMSNNTYNKQNIKFLDQKINCYLYIGKILFENKNPNQKYKDVIKKYYPNIDLENKNNLISIFNKFINLKGYDIKKKNINALIFYYSKIKDKIKNLFNKNELAIMGVDGTGKTTLVSLLQDIFGEKKSYVQYMGLKKWETNLAQKALNFSHNNNNLLGKILNNLGIYFEMLYRVLKHKNKYYLVLYDRYTWDIFLRKSMSKFKKSLYKMIYFYLFFSPKKVIYLTCDEKISIQRKGDIVTQKDKNKLRNKKKIYDKFYSNKDNVIIIKTDEKTEKEVLKIILNIIQKEYF